jgi:hypothetical protein
MTSIVVALKDDALAEIIIKEILNAGHDVNRVHSMYEANSLFAEKSISCIVSDEDFNMHQMLPQQWAMHRTITLLRSINKPIFDEVYTPPNHEFELVPLDLEALLEKIEMLINNDI